MGTCSVDIWLHGTFTITLLTIGLEACNGADLDLVGKSKSPSWANFTIEWVKFPDLDRGILIARYEPSIVLQPVNPFDSLIVSDKFEILRDGCCVELVHPDFFVILTSKEVTSV